MWIIFSVVILILIILGVTIPIIIVTKNKGRATAGIVSLMRIHEGVTGLLVTCHSQKTDIENFFMYLRCHLKYFVRR